MEFEKDIFISYAHADNSEVDEKTKGWVIDFHDALARNVYEKWGKKPIIWRDDRLRGNDFFVPEILSQFPKLKLLVSIITPRYLESQWCKDEVEAFLEAAEKTGGISIDNKARIFKILKTPVPEEKQPEEIREIIGYPFYGEDPKSKRIREFKFEFGETFKNLFYQTVDDVAQDIALLLEKLSSGSESAQSYKGKIYLADTSEDLKECRNTIRRELEDRGYAVLPNKNLTLVADKFISEVEEFMKGCMLSIHLIGNEDYGIVPGKTDKSILVLQNEIAAKHRAANNLNSLIWLAPKAKPVDPPILIYTDSRLDAFIHDLENKEQLNEGSDLLKSDLEDFKKAITSYLKKREEQEAKKKEKEVADVALADKKVEATDIEPKLIFFICDQPDIEDSKPLRDYLKSARHQVKVPSFKGDGMVQEADYLEACDAVIIYYGNGSSDWIEKKLLALNKIKTKRSSPFLDKVVYIAKPANEENSVTEEKKDFDDIMVTVINGQDGFSPDLLKDFLNKINYPISNG